MNQIFNPLILKWFNGVFGSATEIQEKAWPEIAAGRHVLITAPTGSGKTLTAFLWAVNQLMTGVWEGGEVRVVYVSPLKALNNDVYKNLIKPLAELETYFSSRGERFFSVRVLTRSGDTSQPERRAMIRRPPEILITTPESLNIMINTHSGRGIFRGVTTVILDEIHAVVGNKRGVHLMSAVDRLVPLCGEFQRIALSATVKPMEKIAAFIGGYQTDGGPIEPLYKQRKVKIIRSEKEKKIDVGICFPEDALEKLEDNSWWPALIDAFTGIVEKNRSTLLFANSRRLTEKVTRLINESFNQKTGELPVYAHHGALSREIRLAVEQKMKNGDLKAIVATNSLELGIDIGDLDQVVLVQSPFSVSSAIQRIGRSGHRIGQTSRGILFPTHGRDFINAAVLARCVTEKDIEPVTPVNCPLDVLAQIISAMTGVETWDVDALFYFLKTSTPYHNLSRSQYDTVLEMLSGRYADTRIRELSPRIYLDRVDNTIKARPGTMMLVHMAGGTIPDTGQYNLRVQDTKSKIGELDEEFVWERNVGDTFALGAQTWRVMKITHNDIEVIPAANHSGMFPFWKAEARHRDFHLSEKIGLFLEKAETMLEKKEETFLQELKNIYAMDTSAANQLVSFLKLQKEVTQTSLPHRYHLLIEHFDDPLNNADSKQVILHTLWGGKINRPFAIALSTAWEATYHYPLEVFADDDCILLMLPHALDMDSLINLVNAGNIETWLRHGLEKTGLFGAKFRENAGRALLLPKTGINKRMPLWLNRLRSRKLLDATIKIKKFPILMETWRTCLQDEFDMQNLKMLLDEIADGHIRISNTRTTSASPFAGNLVYQQINKYMYEDDTPESGKTSGISRRMLQEVAGINGVYPGIPGHLIDALQQKLQRTAPFYAPSTSEDLLDLVKERLLIPEKEWQCLLRQIKKEHRTEWFDLLEPLVGKIFALTLPNASCSCICAVETLPGLLKAFDLSLDQLRISPLPEENKSASGLKLSLVEENLRAFHFDTDNEADNRSPAFIGQWLSYYGPVCPVFIEEIFGINPVMRHNIIKELMETDFLIQGRFRENSDDILVVNQDNYEILLRMARKSRVPAFSALPIDDLSLFQALYQGIIEPGINIKDLQDRLDQLFGFIAPAEAWETYIFPARLDPYFTSWIDSLMQSSELTWFGSGLKKVGFAFQQDVELFISPEADNGKPEEEHLLPDRNGRYGFFDIARHAGLDSNSASKALWEQVWQGNITNDTFTVLRMGILNNFKPEKNVSQGRGRRGQFNRWKSSRPLLGSWYHINIENNSHDVMEEIEILKDRVRQVLKRYGILFREILIKEQPLLNWSSLFKTLRLMELSGEILSGYFFEGIPGIQFISPEAFRMLQTPMPEDAVYWMNAADPASLCGVPLKGIKKRLPSRMATTNIVFHGREPVLVSKKSGKAVFIHVPPEHPRLFDYISFFRKMLNREFNSARSILVEKINDINALKSPYAEAFRTVGFAGDYKGLELRRINVV